MIELDPDRPRRRQIAEYVRGQIESGVLRPNGRVPSEEDLAEEFGVTRETVRAAYRILEDEGLVVFQQRRGFPRARYVRPDSSRREVRMVTGDRAITRLPNQAERQALKVPANLPLMIVTHPDGTVDTYPGDDVELVS